MPANGPPTLSISFSKLEKAAAKFVPDGVAVFDVRHIGVMTRNGTGLMWAGKQPLPPQVQLEGGFSFKHEPSKLVISHEPLLAT